MCNLTIKVRPPNTVCVTTRYIVKNQYLFMFTSIHCYIGYNC